MHTCAQLLAVSMQNNTWRSHTEANLRAKQGLPKLLARMCAQADAVFLSPPWGGPSYSASTFDVSTDIGGLGIGIQQLLATATALLAPSDTSDPDTHRASHWCASAFPPNSVMGNS